MSKDTLLKKITSDFYKEKGEFSDGTESYEAEGLNRLSREIDGLILRLTLPLKMENAALCSKITALEEENHLLKKKLFFAQNKSVITGKRKTEKDIIN